MVGYLRYPTIEEEPPELEKPDDLPPVEYSVSAPDDFSLSFADSLLDFDSIRDWIGAPEVLDMTDSNTGLEKVDTVTAVVGAVDGGMGMDKDGPCMDTTCRDTHGDGFQKLGNPGSSIEEEIRKVSLEGGSGVLVAEDANSGENPAVEIGAMSGATGISGKSVEIGGINENAEKSTEVVSAEILTINGDGPKIDDTESDGDDSKSTSESDSNPSSSSSSSSSKENDDDEDEETGTEEQENLNEEVEGEMDIEEGEIRDSDVEQMVAWSGDEDDEEDGNGMKGPIRSKNELQALPFVPPVNVTLLPHHQTLPVGVILSIIGAQVIVEGVENHNPLTEGSILWITDSRTPLGLVDEIFGPVKSPYYIIRYNSENEVPAGVKQGTSISFVQEFVNHVLNDRNLYKKGYDASGENDEEISDEAEFSDDEKEAEYKRMLKMTKRGTNDPKLGNAKKDKKKFKNRGGTWQNSQTSTSQSVEGGHQLPTNQNQHRASPHAISMDHGNSSHSFGTSQGFAGNPGLVPPFPQMVQAPGFIPPSSGVWTNGMPCEQQQRMVFPNGVPSNGMPWLQQNFHQQSYQMPMPNIMPFQQQFVPNQILPPNIAFPGAQSNFSAGPAFGPWPGFVGQNGNNQPFGMGLQCQQAPMSMNAPNVGPSTRPVIPANTEVPQKFNQGSYRGQGRKPHHRGGGGRFSGGRGRQSK